MLKRRAMTTGAGAGAGAGDDGWKKAIWARGVGEWSDHDAAGDAAYVPPARPMTWRRDDSGFAATCDDFDRDADRRIIAMIRQRALAGDTHALALGFRAARGMARSVDATPRTPTLEPLPPDVAGAMIEAGLRAMNLDLADIPDRPPTDTHRPANLPTGLGPKPGAIPSTLPRRWT
jgi:hypothetical protein